MSHIVYMTSYNMSHFIKMKFSSMVAQVSLLARGEVISRERRNTREIGPELVGRKCLI